MLLLLFVLALGFGLYYLTPAAATALMARPISTAAFTIAMGFATLAAAILANAYLTGFIRQLKERNAELNSLYQDTMAEKLNYKHEKEDLVQEVLRLEGEVAARDRKIQQLSDQIQIEGMKDEVEVKAELTQEAPADKLIHDIDDLKASIVKVKSRRKKKQ